MLSANNRGINNFISVPNNKNLIHTHKFHLFWYNNYSGNNLNTRLSSKHNRIPSSVSAISSSSAPPDVVEVDGSNSASTTVSSSKFFSLFVFIYYFNCLSFGIIDRYPCVCVHALLRFRVSFITVFSVFSV